MNLAESGRTQGIIRTNVADITTNLYDLEKLGYLLDW